MIIIVLKRGCILEYWFYVCVLVISESSRSTANQNKKGNESIQCIHLKICVVREDVFDKAYLNICTYLSF